jgi:hypothetical protein
MDTLAQDRSTGAPGWFWVVLIIACALALYLGRKDQD